MLKDKVKFKIKLAIQKFVPPFYRRYSYAQAGEDVILDFLLQEVGIEKPTYLEVGVYEPIRGSNTYKFYERGARGVLIEADRSLIPWIRFTRPKDKVIHCGVTVEGQQKEADFFVFDSPGINTFSEKDAHERQKSGRYRLVRQEKVPLKTINDILAENFDDPPDILSIDIEGLDFDVLKSLDFGEFPIPILCVETCSYSENHIREKNTEIREYLKTKKYFPYADTYINTIFVRKDWFDRA